ncbi:unnamed protein product [Penicillium manginii]
MPATEIIAPINGGYSGAKHIIVPPYETAKALWEMMAAARSTDCTVAGETPRTRHAGVSCLFDHLQDPFQMAIRSRAHCECKLHNVAGLRRISFGAFYLLNSCRSN